MQKKVWFIYVSRFFFYFYYLKDIKKVAKQWSFDGQKVFIIYVGKSAKHCTVYDKCKTNIYIHI